MRKVLYILGQLNDEDVEWMAATGRKRSAAKPGETLIHQGVACADLYFVLDGHAVVTIAGVGEVARLGAGEVFGEMSFVDSALPSATVTAEQDCVTLALERRLIDARLHSDTGFAARFYRALALFLADRLRGMNARGGGSANLASKDVAEDELDEALLDNVSVAGARFEHMLRILSAAPTTSD